MFYFPARKSCSTRIGVNGRSGRPLGPVDPSARSAVVREPRCEPRESTREGGRVPRRRGALGSVARPTSHDDWHERVRENPRSPKNEDKKTTHNERLRKRQRSHPRSPTTVHRTWVQYHAESPKCARPGHASANQGNESAHAARHAKKRVWRIFAFCIFHVSAATLTSPRLARPRAEVVARVSGGSLRVFCGRTRWGARSARDMTPMRPRP